MPYLDTEEEYVAETLRNIMQNKTARYGAYDFIGRVMAFTHLDNGKTVAAVTNDFMDQFEDREHEPLRQAFLRAFDKVMDWYAFPLSTPVQNGKFPWVHWDNSTCYYSPCTQGYRCGLAFRIPSERRHCRRLDDFRARNSGDETKLRDILATAEGVVGANPIHGPGGT